MLILEPDDAQARRLGWTRVKAANLAGLAIGLIVALALIAALTA